MSWCCSQRYLSGEKKSFTDLLSICKKGTPFKAYFPLTHWFCILRNYPRKQTFLVSWIYYSVFASLIHLFSKCDHHRLLILLVLRNLLCDLFSFINFYNLPAVDKKSAMGILVKVRIHCWFACVHHNLWYNCQSYSLSELFLSYPEVFRMPHSTSFSPTPVPSLLSSF